MKKILFLLLSTLLLSSCNIRKEEVKDINTEFVKHNKQTIYWSSESLPIILAYSSAESKEFKESLARVVVEYNRQIGKTVLTMKELNPQNPIMLDFPVYGYVSVYTTKLPYTREQQVHSELIRNYVVDTSRMHSAHLAISSETNKKHYYKVLLREVGTVLGLAYDKDEDSVMNLETELNNKEQTFEVTDVELLKLMYNPTMIL